MNEIEREIAENVIGAFEQWGQRIEFVGHTARRTNVYLGDPQTEMTCMVEGYGEFRIIVNVEQLSPYCQTCDSGGHECGGCGHSIAHGARDCRGAGGPGCPTYEEMTEAEVRADRLAEGDEIWSDATGRWHEVIEAGSHNGSTTIVVRKTETSTHRFQPKPETTYRTRRGPAGRVVNMLGGEVIHSG